MTAGKKGWLSSPWLSSMFGVGSRHLMANRVTSLSRVAEKVPKTKKLTPIPASRLTMSTRGDSKLARNHSWSSLCRCPRAWPNKSSNIVSQVSRSASCDFHRHNSANGRSSCRSLPLKVLDRYAISACETNFPLCQRSGKEVLEARIRGLLKGGRVGSHGSVGTLWRPFVWTFLFQLCPLLLVVGTSQKLMVLLPATRVSMWTKIGFLRLRALPSPRTRD